MEGDSNNNKSINRGNLKKIPSLKPKVPGDLTLRGEQINYTTRESNVTSITKTSMSMSMSMSNTQESFRKSLRNFNKSEYFSTILQILKTDLIQIQETINENMYIAKLFKLSVKSFPVHFQRKMADFEEKQDIKNQIEQIVDQSKNIEFLLKQYNVNNANELIEKLYVEMSYYDIFINKLNDLFFLLNLKVNGEENLQQNTHSKFSLIKSVIDTLLEKSSNYFESEEKIKISQPKELSVSQNNNENNRKISKFREIKNISEFFEKFKENNDKDDDMIYLGNVLQDDLRGIFEGFNELLHRYTNKSVKVNDFIGCDNFFQLKLFLEKYLKETNLKLKEKQNNQQDDEEILKKLQNEIEELKKINQKQLKEFNEQNESFKRFYENKISELNEKIEKIEKTEKIHNNAPLNNQSTSTNDLMKIIDKSIFS